VNLNAPTTLFTKAEQIGNFRKEPDLAAAVFIQRLEMSSQILKMIREAWTFITSPIQNAPNVLVSMTNPNVLLYAQLTAA
jgi:hypothetical protein